MPSRITADTNIYISALNFGGIPERVLTLARDGHLDLAISDAILSEIVRVLTEKFRWAPGPLKNALIEIAAYSRRIEPQQKLDVITDDPTDNRILECAISAGSEYIVSGDSHLLRIGKYAGIPILRPAELLEVVRKRSF